MTLLYDVYNQKLRANQELAGALKGEGIADTSLGTVVIQVGHRTKGKPRYYEDETPAVTQDYGTGGQNVPLIIHENKSGSHTPHAEAQALRSGASHNYQTIANAVDPDGYLRFGQRPRDDKGKPQLLPIGYRRIRRLTPIECERLQGFPDDWTKYGLAKEGKQIEISDTQRYKCCGNAVTTNVITAIGRQLLEEIGGQG